MYCSTLQRSTVVQIFFPERLKDTTVIVDAQVLSRPSVDTTGIFDTPAVPVVHKHLDISDQARDAFVN